MYDNQWREDRYAEKPFIQFGRSFVLCAWELWDFWRMNDWAVPWWANVAPRGSKYGRIVASAPTVHSWEREEGCVTTTLSPSACLHISLSYRAAAVYTAPMLPSGCSYFLGFYWGTDYWYIWSSKIPALRPCMRNCRSVVSLIRFLDSTWPHYLYS